MAVLCQARWNVRHMSHSQWNSIETMNVITVYQRLQIGHLCLLPMRLLLVSWGHEGTMKMVFNAWITRDDVLCVPTLLLIKRRKMTSSWGREGRLVNMTWFILCMGRQDEKAGLKGCIRPSLWSCSSAWRHYIAHLWNMQSARLATDPEFQINRV